MIKRSSLGTAGGLRTVVPHLIALEPRMMFDGAAVATAATTLDSIGVLDPRDAVQLDAPEPHHFAPSTRADDLSGWALDVGLADWLGVVQRDRSAPNEVIFIDRSVDNYEELAGQWADRGQVILIDADRDGIDQMRQALIGMTGIDAIHIVSHGSAGSFDLGNTRIDVGSINGELMASFAAIGGKLSVDGDILVYGCDFGEGPVGQEAMNALARVTGADIAASTDATGSATLGGDWKLEASNGYVQSSMLASDDFSGLLARTNTGPWTINGNTSTTVVDGITVSITITGAGSSTFAGTSNGAFNNIAAFDNGAQGQPSLSTTWTTTNATDVGTITISFSQAVINPVIHLDRLGGAIGTTSNSALLTLLTSGATLAKIAGPAHFVVDSGTRTVTRTIGQTVAANTESSLDGTQGTAAGSVRIGGTFTSVQFSIRATGAVGSDGFEIGTAVDASPIARNDVFTQNEDFGSFSGNLLNNNGNNADSDPRGDTLTVVSVRNSAGTAIPVGTPTMLASGASVTLNANGTFTYADNGVDNGLAVGQTRVETLSYTISDANGGTSTATATITITGANDAPVAVNDSATTAEDTAVTVAVLANDSDVDRDSLSVSSATAANGTVTINPDGTLTYRPNANFNGTDAIIYVVSDGRGGTATATVAVTVTAVDDAPVNTVPGAQITAEDAPIVFSNANGNVIAIVDVEGAPQTVTLSVTNGSLTLGSLAGLTFSQGDGTADSTMTFVGSLAAINQALQGLTYAPLADFNGTAQITLRTVDSSTAQSDTDTIAITVTPVADIANDSVTTAEDTPIAINVFGNDSFENAARMITAVDGVTIIAGGAAVAVANGSVSLNAAGQLVFAPTANYNGTTSFTYRVTSNGTTETANATVVVTAVNDAPVALGTLPARTNVDAASVTFGTIGAFSDVDNAALTYSTTGLPAGLTIDAVTGVISGTINRSASQPNGGLYTVVVTARDAAGATATQSFGWTITNPAPVAANDSASTSEDTSVTIAVLANDTDPDGDPLTVVAASAANGAVTINANGTLTYTPNANFNGTDAISYTISDGQGGSSSATVAITIAAVNDAPIAVGTLPARSNPDAATVSIATAAGFNDVDNATLTYSATGLPAGLTINAATGVISGTIDRSASQANGGNYAVVVTARDAAGLTATQGFAWTVTNPAPLAVNDTASTSEDTPVTIAVLANDNDPDGDPLTVVSASAANGVVVINANGTLTYTPNANYNGADTITYTISDGQGGTRSATVAVTIVAMDDAPTPVGTLPARSNADAAIVSVATAGGFADVDDATLTYTAIGLPSGLTINEATGVISGTINRSASQVVGGVYSVVVTARDAGGLTATQGFTWTITNPAPVAANDSATTDEDVPVMIAVLANDTDPDGDPLTVVSASATRGSVVINANGTLTYTPSADYNGSDTIAYVISDAQGGTSTATVLVSIAARNDAPTAVNDTGTVNEDTTATIVVLANDSDRDGDPLTVITAAAANGTVTINPNGTLTYRANANFSGSDTITYTISDGQGGTATATVAVTVVPVNDAPTAVGTLPARSNLDADVVSVATAGGFTDVDSATLTYSATGLPAGLTVDAATGVILGTINRSASQLNGGIYAVTVTARDTAGLTATQSFGWTVTNPAPIVANDTATTSEDTPVSIVVLANDVDPDGDPLTVIAASAINGTVSIAADGSLVYTPRANFNGPDTINYTISDGQGSTTTATVAVTVTPVNDRPVAVNDTAATNEDTPVTIPVLANDSDVDGDPLTVTAGSAANGMVVINANGTLTYTPNANFNGNDTISYTISDGQGGFSTASITVTVAAVNDAPVRVGTLPPRNDADGDAVSLGTAGAFDDVDNPTLTYSATGLPTGLMLDTATGVISGTIDRSASQVGGGAYTVTVTATDAAGLSASQSFTW
ncbi:Ig-like domain-containing protein, partial [Sphingomonas prati]